MENISDNESRLVLVDQRAIIKNADGEVLLVKYKDENWDLPGGELKEGSSWQESLEQTLHEQLGIEVIAQFPVHTSDFIDPSTGKYTYVNIIVCETYKDLSEIQTEEFAEYTWADMKDLAKLEFATADVKSALIEQFEVTGL